MGFKLELINNEIFKVAFDSVSKIVDEVTVNIDSEGFHMEAIDRSHICFVSLHLNYDLFDSFQCDAPEKLHLDTVEFMQILKRMKRTDVLCLSADMNNLIIKLQGDVDKQFKIRLIDIDYETPSAPNLDLPVGVDIESSLVKDALVDMNLFSDSLTFKVDSEYLRISTDGEFGDASFEYLHGERGITETVESSYSIEKLKDIFVASKFSEFVRLYIGNSMPMKIDFTTLDEEGTLSYLLAPKINQEDDY